MYDNIDLWEITISYKKLKVHTYRYHMSIKLVLFSTNDRRVTYQY